MIWYLIGYVLMGIVGSDFIVGVMIGIALFKRGYLSDLEIFTEYVSQLSWDRIAGGAFAKILPKNRVGYTVWRGFYVMTWPVEFMRNIFLDIPDAIEWYETQHIKGEEA